MAGCGILSTDKHPPFSWIVLPWFLVYIQRWIYLQIKPVWPSCSASALTVKMLFFKVNWNSVVRDVLSLRWSYSCVFEWLNCVSVYMLAMHVLLWDISAGSYLVEVCLRWRNGCLRRLFCLCWIRSDGQISVSKSRPANVFTAVFTYSLMQQL